MNYDIIWDMSTTEERHQLEEEMKAEDPEKWEEFKRTMISLYGSLGFEYFIRKHSFQTAYYFCLYCYVIGLFFFFKKYCEDIISSIIFLGRFPQNHGINTMINDIFL